MEYAEDERRPRYNIFFLECTLNHNIYFLFFVHIHTLIWKLIIAWNRYCPTADLFYIARLIEGLLHASGGRGS